MIKLPFKKNKGEAPVRVSDKYRDIRRERRTLRLKRVQFDVKKRFKVRINKPLFLKIGLISFFIGALSFSIYFVLTSPIFNVEEIEITGSESIRRDSFNEFLNKNLFKLRNGKIKEYGFQNIENLESIYVRKVLPNKLVIEAIQSTPNRLVITFDKVYIINSRGKISEEIILNKFSMSDFENDILIGIGDFNADYVKENFLASLPEDERAAVKWEEVPIEKKKEILNNLEISLIGRINSYFLNTKEVIPEEHKVLESINFYNYSSDLSKDEIEERIAFNNEVIKFLSESTYNIDKLEWYAIFSLRAISADKTFLFSLKRDLEESKEDFLIAKEEGLLNSGSVFDFRTDKFSVK